MIDLFPHNQIAYESVVAMLSDTARAAIIHPTGTGKSFIGFKLCEDIAARDPEAVVCWLSPSEYIFKTQLENIRDASGHVPENVVFCTYAKLMLMSEEQIAELHPAAIILDEFHRCGAEMWGRGVQNLLNAYPDVPVLGLSATNVRYLDNQRDMADELFDGHIASEMTLGDAIVRGILDPPKYVLSVFSYQKDLETYERRVRRTKSRAVRDAGQEYLDALRRAMDKADGLDVIFDKHMTDRTGKYIVFCANKEHMNEMIAYARDWFGKVDSNPHIYTLYTEDPAADKSFAAFKADSDSSHLRLLYAIDALNEGVHVEDVSGVILLRPTVSPIIYKQQIGRALSASKKREPVIFDIVNNIENLYGIGAIEEEMRAAVTYYRYFGMGEEIVNEHFTVYDEVRTCKELFERLDETLTASWEFMYAEAQRYHAEYGNLDVPKRYKTPDGYSLGSWITVQRRVRAGEQFGNLSPERIARLDELGMRWDSAKDVSWNRYYAAAQTYHAEHGDLNVKAAYVTSNGVRLGAWISNLRTTRKSGNTSAYTTPARISMLDAIGMIWNQPDYVFERNFAAALLYYRQHGDLNVPAKCTVNGVKLGIWIRNLRATVNGQARNASLSDTQMKRLNELGMQWTDKYTALWENGFAEAEIYFRVNGNLDILLSYKTQTGYALGRWLYRQRENYRNKELSADRVERLTALGMNWGNTRRNDWDTCFALVQQYYEDYRHIRMPADYVTDGIWLYKWLNEQKQIYNGRRVGKVLTEEQIKKLESVGIDWTLRNRRHSAESTPKKQNRPSALPAASAQS